MKTAKLVVHTELNSGIYRSDREAAADPRNDRRYPATNHGAARARAHADRTTADNCRCYGNVGSGHTGIYLQTPEMEADDFDLDVTDAIGDWLDSTYDRRSITEVLAKWLPVVADAAEV